MGMHYLELNSKGQFDPVGLPTGASHSLIVRTLTLDHRYHDDDPVRNAPFKVTFPNGLVVEGALDASGRATVYGVPAGPVAVQFGPDQRSYERVDQADNPDFRQALSDANVTSLVSKYRG